MMATRHTGDTMSHKDSKVAEVMRRLVEEDRAESAPPQREDKPMKPAYKHPALALLTFKRWDDAFGHLHAISEGLLGEQRSQALLDAANDRKEVQAEIREAIEILYADRTPPVGQLALAWQTLTCDPRRAYTFWSVLPQITFALDAADLRADDDADLRRRLRVWWRAAEAEWPESEVSIFRIAAVEGEFGDQPSLEPLIKPTLAEWLTPKPKPTGPTLVVMPKHRSSKLNNHNAPYNVLVDAALPLVVVRDVREIRKTLHREFPHAVAAVDMLIRDLRDGRPFHIKPVCLVGSAGSGKTRIVRRLAALVSESSMPSTEKLHVHRFDGAVSDGQFAGTAKGWSNTEPSVPVRAVRQSMTANPLVMIDEADKATSSQNGFLGHSLLQFADPETSSRVRDQSLDAELDLSMVSFILTANDAKLLPGMLRDRFRMIRMPTPTLLHLPALAAQVMADLAHDDEARAGDAPLAPDELAGMGKKWAGAGFSMRKLKSIVEATLYARDSCAPRH